jgi:hypothetical protein
MLALKEKFQGVVSSSTTSNLLIFSPYVRNLEKVRYLKKETTFSKNRKAETEEEDFIVSIRVSELITLKFFSPPSCQASKTDL